VRRVPPGSRKKPFWYEAPKVSWEDVLAVLATATEPLQIREVTERAGIKHRQDTHRRLERLRERGAVTKIKEGDRVYWVITDLGRRAHEGLING
jgi:DNA-binding IclR family transcriptional regulator